MKEKLRTLKNFLPFVKFEKERREMKEEQKELEKKLPRLIKIENLDLIPEIPKKQLVEIISKFLLFLMDRSGDIIKVGNITLSVYKGEAVTKTRSGHCHRTKMIFLHSVEK